MSKEKCVRCGEDAEIETEKGFLCESCDASRLQCLNNIEEERTEEDFWKEVELNNLDWKELYNKCLDLIEKTNERLDFNELKTEYEDYFDNIDTFKSRERLVIAVMQEEERYKQDYSKEELIDFILSIQKI